MKKPNSVINQIKKHKIMTMGVVLALALLGSFLFVHHALNAPLEFEDEVYHLEVLDGDSMNSVFDYLQTEGIIPNATIAKLYARYTDKSDVYIGNYVLQSGWNVKEIVDYLNETVPIQDVVIVLKDGGWAKDFAHALELGLEIDAQEFLNSWNDETYIRELMLDYPVLTEEIFNNQVRVLLEGYLYPDTYYIPDYADVDAVTRQILDNTQKNYNTIVSMIEQSDFTTHEVMILSSVVLYEAGSNEDQQMVAGVFMNRLAIDMPLQSSVTVCYALYEFEDWTDCELYVNQAIDSPYNTYVYTGLPVGPILNPNILAIENTLNYDKHDYYYFVADVYEGGDGTVYYSKTYQQHLNKINELENR